MGLTEGSPERPPGQRAGTGAWGKGNGDGGRVAGAWARGNGTGGRGAAVAGAQHSRPLHLFASVHAPLVLLLLAAPLLAGLLGEGCAAQQVLGMALKFEAEEKGTGTGAGTGAGTAAAGGGPEAKTGAPETKDLNRNLSLAEAVEFVAGPDRKIIVATSTENYLDFVENLLASAARVGYREKILVIAEDDSTFVYLHAIIPNQTVKGWEVAPSEIRGSARDIGGGANKEFFNSVLLRRPRYLLAILDLNVTLLSSDVDNVFLKDPFPEFTGAFDLWLMEDLSTYQRDAKWDPVPMVRNPKLNYCTCLIYMVPNEANKAMLRELMETMEDHTRKNPLGVFEQTEWNLVLSTYPAGLAVRVGVLSPFLFPTGCIFFGCRKYLREQWAARIEKERGEWSEVAVVVQNNWLQSHAAKVDRFKQHGMWYVK